MPPHFFPLSDFGPAGRRAWPRFMVEELDARSHRLHRCACQCVDGSVTEIGRFSTYLTAQRIARLTTRGAVELCPHCIRPKRT